MRKTSKTNSYDVRRDMISSPVRVIWLDDATGAAVSGPGQGVSGFAIMLRSMMGEDGTAGAHRVAVCAAFPSKGSDKAQARWVVGPKGIASLSDKPAAGSVCVGAGIGRLAPHIAATLYVEAGAFSARLQAALAKRNAA
jgi:hypothetical protein